MSKEIAIYTNADIHHFAQFGIDRTQQNKACIQPMIDLLSTDQSWMSDPDLCTPILNRIRTIRPPCTCCFGCYNEMRGCSPLEKQIIAIYHTMYQIFLPKTSLSIDFTPTLTAFDKLMFNGEYTFSDIETGLQAMNFAVLHKMTPMVMICLKHLLNKICFENKYDNSSPSHLYELLRRLPWLSIKTIDIDKKTRSWMVNPNPITFSYFVQISADIKLREIQLLEQLRTLLSIQGIWITLGGKEKKIEDLFPFLTKYTHVVLDGQSKHYKHYTSTYINRNSQLAIELLSRMDNIVFLKLKKLEFDTIPYLSTFRDDLQISKCKGKHIDTLAKRISLHDIKTNELSANQAESVFISKSCILQPLLFFPDAKKIKISETVLEELNAPKAQSIQLENNGNFARLSSPNATYLHLQQLPAFKQAVLPSADRVDIHKCRNFEHLDAPMATRVHIEDSNAHIQYMNIPMAEPDYSNITWEIFPDCTFLNVSDEYFLIANHPDRFPKLKLTAYQNRFYEYMCVSGIGFSYLQTFDSEEETAPFRTIRGIILKEEEKLRQKITEKLIKDDHNYDKIDPFDWLYKQKSYLQTFYSDPEFRNEFDAYLASLLPPEDAFRHDPIGQRTEELSMVAVFALLHDVKILTKPADNPSTPE